jgi:hypothetical protein
MDANYECREIVSQKGTVDYDTGPIKNKTHKVVIRLRHAYEDAENCGTNKTC